MGATCRSRGQGASPDPAGAAAPRPARLLIMLILGLAACTSYESQYEKSVYHLEPIYCYQTIGAVDCRREPHARDTDRLVNYYGPAPSKHDPPDPPRLSPLRPPPDGSGYWRDPEPIPGPAAVPDLQEEAGEAPVLPVPRNGSGMTQTPPPPDAGPKKLLPAPSEPPAPDDDGDAPASEPLTET
jgi:hypothetical protein